MKKSTPTHLTDEAIAFVVFLACCVISFFRHPEVVDMAASVSN